MTGRPSTGHIDLKLDDRMTLPLLREELTLAGKRIAELEGRIATVITAHGYVHAPRTEYRAGFDDALRMVKRTLRGDA